LFLMSDTGGGHRSAAQAIAAALAQGWPGAARVMLFDFFAGCTPWPLSRAGSLYGSIINHAPWAWAALYAMTDGRRRIEWLLRVVAPPVSRCLVARLRADPPDVLVSVHPLANHLAVATARRLALRDDGPPCSGRSPTEPGGTVRRPAPATLAHPRIPVVTIVTDLVTAHAGWFCPDVDRCIVPTEAAGACGLSHGMPPDKIEVVGLPVDPRFGSQAIDRVTLGLQPDRFTVLLVGGGEGMGRVYDLARAVAEARLPVQLVVIAGRNTRLRQRLERTVWGIPTTVHGFVTNMPDWMRTADVIVTKAGPGTVSEALIVGLPILLIGFVPGQEAGNVRFVVENGAGLLTDTPEKLVSTLRELTARSGDRPQQVAPGAGRLREMSERARRLARPDAATQIARLILEMANSR
jgi:1,2-diacylglycerol 3-beta-galactosyltransferase